MRSFPCGTARCEPEMDRRVHAGWWEQIVDPDSHASWRRTRALYEIECRKPPLKDTMPPG